MAAKGAKAGAKGSKNNIMNRGAAASLKVFNGKEVKPILYKGSNLGHGSYIAAKTDSGELVRDATGRPVPYQDL